MRPKTKLPIPNPDGKSEFENFDRLTRILVKAEKPKCKKDDKKKSG